MHRMRNGFFGLAGALAFAAAAAVPDTAQAHYYPWCAHYTGMDYGGAISCGYVTREQCMASVSGVGGFCEQNFPQPASVRPARPARKPAPR
jgi:hypothetical protein